MKKIKVIIGLCNFPHEYTWTRHNIAKDFLMASDLVFEEGKNFLLHSQENDTSIIYWIIPKTYMNVSGDIFRDNMLKQLYQKYEEIQTIVIHDDLAVSFGQYKIRANKDRGPRGHNGNRSIINALSKLCGSKYEQPVYFSLGIGRSEIEPVDVWVLKKFNSEEQEKLIASIFPAAKEVLLKFIAL
jgi:peptidyl-tRNA hydrolase